MYRCKECNTEYKIKPDYCECGNDTFEEISKGFTLEQKYEVLSRIFFVLCLVLGISIWLIPVKTKPHHSTPTTSTPAKTTIPDINKIWNDTPISQPQIQTPAKTEPVVLNSAPVQKKNIATKQQPKQVPATNMKPNTLQQPKVEQKSAPISKSPSKAEPVKIVQPPKKTEPSKPAYNPNSPEMLRYKTNLRAALFSKFAVGSIQGSGSCSISFSVDSTGKLINRKFTKESDNKSLNDTVYYMLMSVPKYTPPPAGYNGETINMNFTINNGNYEISIH